MSATTFYMRCCRPAAAGCVPDMQVFKCQHRPHPVLRKRGGFMYVMVSASLCIQCRHLSTLSTAFVRCCSADHVSDKGQMWGAQSLSDSKMTPHFHRSWSLLVMPFQWHEIGLRPVRVRHVSSRNSSYQASSSAVALITPSLGSGAPVISSVNSLVCLLR